MMERSRRQKPIDTLLSMGFSRTAASQALSSHSSTEAALDYLLSQNAKDEDKEDPICEVCLMALKEPGIAAAPVHAANACAHLFHQQCLRSWLEVRITEGNIEKIACPSCPSLLTQADVFRLVSPALQAKYLKFKRNAELQVNPNVRWCPSPGCETPILGKSHPRLGIVMASSLAKTAVVGLAGTALGGLAGYTFPVVWTATGACTVTWLVSVTKKHGKFYWKGASMSQCPKCRTAICFDCSLPFHPDKHCKQTDMALLKNWAEGKDTCYCPSCNSMIEKKEGCNHMTCRCGCQFCWLCHELYSPTHFSQGGCKQFGGGLVTPRQQVAWTRRALIAFVAFVVFLRLAVPLSTSLYYYFYPLSRTHVCPVPDPFSASSPLPVSFTPNWSAVYKSLAAYLGFELCLILYSLTFLCGRRDPNQYVRTFRFPAALRYFYWLTIPALALIRWLFTYPRVVVGIVSFMFMVVAFASLARRRSLIWRRLLLVPLVLAFNWFEWPVWLLAWLGELGLSLGFGVAITGGAALLFAMSIGRSGSESADLFSSYHFGRFGIYLSMASALSVFFCLHFLGLSHWSLRLGMFGTSVFLAGLSCSVASRGAVWRWPRRIPALFQAAVGVACYGAVLLLVRDPVQSADLFSKAMSAVVSSSVWGYLRLPFDVLAIAALPVIFNLAQD